MTFLISWFLPGYMKPRVLQVAGGLVDMAIGGDQGGSIRLPSCWTGVVGLKPTFGLVPCTGAMGKRLNIPYHKLLMSLSLTNVTPPF